MNFFVLSLRINKEVKKQINYKKKIKSLKVKINYNIGYNNNLMTNQNQTDNFSFSKKILYLLTIIIMLS